MSETKTETALAVIEKLTPMQLFAPGILDPLLDRIKEEARAEAAKLDISTEKGRKAIASLAHKVARSKTFVDAQAAIEEEQKRAEEKQRKEREETEARERNKKHCAAINRKAADALLTAGITEEQAKAVITLIAKGAVPNVSISY